MENKNQPLDLSYLDDVSGGDENFKKDLIKIFLQQVPEFISNMKKYHIEDDFKNLAKEAHTAKSSVLIFGMEETGAHLKKIQLLAEENQKHQIPGLLEQTIKEMENILAPLKNYVGT
jgi:HPt (histidine-containing phosphotransfer) domain-containing protein